MMSTHPTRPTMLQPISSGWGFSAPEIYFANRMGMTRQEIADAACVSRSTMTRHIRQLQIPMMTWYRGGFSSSARRGRHALPDPDRKWIKIERDDFAYPMSRDGWIMEHRAVVARHLGRLLDSNESVHHINGNPYDNRIENLQLRQGNHGPGQIFQCQDCRSLNVMAVAL